MQITADPGLTLSELIRVELANTNEAISRYDSILWKIRSGYIVILYGALSLVLGAGEDQPVILSPKALIICFSLLGFYTDVTFRRCQLRVVEVRNRLTDLALRSARGETLSPNQLDECLHVAVESAIPVPLERFARAVAFIFTIYAATPVLVMLYERVAG